MSFDQILDLTVVFFNFFSYTYIRSIYTRNRMWYEKHSNTRRTGGLGTPDRTEWSWGKKRLFLEGPYSSVRIIGMIVPAKSTLVRSGKSLRLGRMFCFVSIFVFYSYFFLIVHCSYVPIRTPFCCSSCFSGASSMQMILVLVGLHKVRDDRPQLAGTAPLRPGTEVHNIVFLWSSIQALFAFVCFSRATVYRCTVGFKLLRNWSSM